MTESLRQVSKPSRYLHIFAKFSFRIHFLHYESAVCYCKYVYLRKELSWSNDSCLKLFEYFSVDYSTHLNIWWKKSILPCLWKMRRFLNIAHSFPVLSVDELFLIVCLESDYTCEKYNVLIGNTWFSDDAYFWTSQIFESGVLNFCTILIKKPIIKVKTLYQLISLFCEMILHIKTCS
jgi:hypothetical protein